MKEVVEFIFFGVPLILATLAIVGWIWGMMSALWRVLCKNKREDEAEKDKLTGMEWMQAHMFGTEREKAADDLRDSWNRIQTIAVCVVGTVVLAWIFYGITLLWRHFFG